VYDDVQCVAIVRELLLAFSALTLLVGRKMVVPVCVCVATGIGQLALREQCVFSREFGGGLRKDWARHWLGLVLCVPFSNLILMVEWQE